MSARIYPPGLEATEVLRSYGGDLTTVQGDFVLIELSGEDNRVGVGESKFPLPEIFTGPVCLVANNYVDGQSRIAPPEEAVASKVDRYISLYRFETVEQLISSSSPSWWRGDFLFTDGAFFGNDRLQQQRTLRATAKLILGDLQRYAALYLVWEHGTELIALPATSQSAARRLLRARRH